MKLLVITLMKRRYVVWEPFYAGSQVFHLGNGMGNMRLLDESLFGACDT